MLTQEETKLIVRALSSFRRGERNRLRRIVAGKARGTVREQHDLLQKVSELHERLSREVQP